MRSLPVGLGKINEFLKRAFYPIVLDLSWRDNLLVSWLFGVQDSGWSKIAFLCIVAQVNLTPIQSLVRSANGESPSPFPDSYAPSSRYDPLVR